MVKIPTDFTVDVMRELKDFEHLIYFKWDMMTDVLEFQDTPDEESPFGFSKRIEHASTNFYAGLIHKDDQENLDTYLDELYSNCDDDVRRIIQKFRLRGKNGTDYFWVELRMIVYYYDSMPVIIFGALRNINDEQISQMKLLHEAEHDLLTGFLNKIATEKTIDNFLKTKPARSALVIIDADNFKAVNDTFGHLFGDAVLTEMAMAIRKNFRAIDFMGRIGGDEFIVLFREFPDEEQLKKCCTDLGNDLRKEYVTESKKTVKFSVSIGISFYPEHGKDYAELFNHADRALYESKANGRDQFQFYHTSLFGRADVESTRDMQDTSEIQQKAFQDNMLEFVFKLLFETNDPRATVLWTLGMFGRQYNLDRVSVERYDRITNRYSTDFEWLSPNGISVKQENHQNDISDYSRERTNIMLQLYHPTPYGVMSLCEDTTELDEKYQNTLKFFKLGSFAHVRITHGTRDLGSLCFESARAPRIFSEKELTDLNIFSILLGNILLVRTSDEKVDQENTRLRDILDRMQEFIYVINKNTYEPVFFNQTMRQFLNPISGSLPCYKRFHNLEQPCKGCLVEKLSRNGNEYLHSRLDNWGTPTDTKTYNIIWEENEEKYALVIQDPF